MFLWLRRLRLVQRRTVWCPTWFAIFFIVGLPLLLVTWWWGCGESFLLSTQRLPAEILDALNVFTLGPHARRSRLVFAKVCQPATQVGVVGWAPSGSEGMEWWRSSERAKELLTETAGYVYETLLDSGRGSNSPGMLQTANRS